MRPAATSMIMVFAAFLMISSYDAAKADIGVDNYKKSMNETVAVWAEAANDASKLSKKDKHAKMDKANLDFAKTILVINFPENMTEDDVVGVIADLRTGLEKASKAAFGSGPQVVMKERHNLKEGAPRVLDVTVDLYW